MVHGDVGFGFWLAVKRMADRSATHAGGPRLAVGVQRHAGGMQEPCKWAQWHAGGSGLQVATTGVMQAEVPCKCSAASFRDVVAAGMQRRAGGPRVAPRVQCHAGSMQLAGWWSYK